MEVKNEDVEDAVVCIRSAIVESIEMGHTDQAEHYREVLKRLVTGLNLLTSS